MKIFSLEEAEALIPRLQAAADSAADIRARAEAKAAAVRRLERAGDPAQLAIERGQLEFLSRSLEDLLQGLASSGVALKGLDPFLADFPFVLGGRQVWLCWKQGEKRIRYYHGMDEGFAGRKPLPKDTPH